MGITATQVDAALSEYRAAGGGRAPASLAEALDALQPFLPNNRDIILFGYRGGRPSINVESGRSTDGTRVSCYAHSPNDGEMLSALLAKATARHDAEVAAKTAKSDYAAAEFGSYMPRIAA